MRRRLIYGLAGLVALLVGVGIGASGKSSGNSASTVTRTATVTVTTAAAAPAACRKAIADARLIGVLTAAAIGNAAKWAPLVSRAAIAAASQDVAGINSVTAAATRLNRNTTEETPLVRAAVASFNRDAKSCR